MSVLDDFIKVRLTEETVLPAFDCGDDDLNDFLFSDSINYTRELLAVTYLFIHKDDPSKVGAFVSVANDKLIDRGVRSFWQRVSKQLPHPKRRKDYPSVLLARMGVDTSFQRTGVATEIVNYIKGSFAFDNKTGCRFILVDAYNKPEVIAFYEKNGFLFGVDRDESKRTRFMYYDLMQFIE